LLSEFEDNYTPHEQDRVFPGEQPIKITSSTKIEIVVPKVEKKELEITYDKTMKSERPVANNSLKRMDSIVLPNRKGSLKHKNAA